MFEKVLVIIGVLLFVWVMYPHIRRGEYIAPSPLPPEYWGLAQAPEFEDWTQPDTGYGWYRFDFWNNPPPEGRPVQKSDFRLKL